MNKEMFGRALAVVSLFEIFVAADCSVSVFEQRYGDIWQAPVSTTTERMRFASLQLRNLVKTTIDAQEITEKSINDFCLRVLDCLNQTDITIATLDKQFLPNLVRLRAKYWRQEFWKRDYELFVTLYNVLTSELRKAHYTKRYVKQ